MLTALDSKFYYNFTDRDDGGKIGRGRVGSISIAKSLPVNIPAFLTPSRFEDPDDFDDILVSNWHVQTIVR